VSYPHAHAICPDSSSPDIGPIDDPNMKQGAQVRFTATASAFEPIANVCAPYNRQVDARSSSRDTLRARISSRTSCLAT